MDDNARGRDTLPVEITLLLTATIDPGQTQQVARRDPKTRLSDYEKSLHFWLRSGAVKHIVMYENSAADISSLRDIAMGYPDVKVEFHSFRENAGGALHGKGYSELLGIARVLSDSTILKNCRYVAKCTGRLTVANAKALFRSINAVDFDIMCSLKSSLSHADSRFFVSTPEFIRNYLLPLGEMIDDSQGCFLEHALACATARAVSDRRRWRPFLISPFICGISGTLNKSQTDSMLKRFLRTVLHRLERYIYEKKI